MSDTWVSWLWDAAQDTYASIVRHPFVVDLTSGDLSEERFAYYVVQNELHLRAQVRAMSVVAAKASTTELAGVLAGFAADTAIVSGALREAVGPRLGLETAAFEDAVAEPTTRAYSAHLVATAHGGSFAEGLAALLPCYWVYQQVGQYLAEKGSPDERHQAWIDTYGGDEFAETVQQLLDTADEVGPGLPGAEAWRTRELFVTSTRYEWMLLDAAWRLETWPV